MGGIAEVLWSTFDIDRASAAMIEIGGYRRIDLPDGDESLARAWAVPDGCERIEQALLLPPAAVIVERGGALHVPPCSAVIAPYGEIRLFSVRAPDGAILEFYEEAP